MVCPFCGKDMDEGFVRGMSSRSIYNSNLYWEDEEHKSVLFGRKLQKLYADNHDVGGFPLVKAYKCNDCKKIIMDTYVIEEK